ncbi:ubiquitin carboxyl-terminal hydrolase 14 [Coprinellus micaceus]|uniref:Ubiquitin carboxyl-terminal hydrolase n=1 Tax=Coprinellus micaceus TaxID=71717 RepID=A0A4Y7SDD9_COPMI|nr:ubiquitin carboxyl-terminal hydrolase 14 [Coprinellus micaceus]
MACTHIPNLNRLRPPRLSQSVHREECTQCFDDQDSPSGLEVCLTCFNGGCLSSDRHHAQNHILKTSHNFTLNVKRTPKPSSKSPSRGDGEEPPAKMTKLAILEEREEDKYDTVTKVKCWSCDSSQGKEIGQDVVDAQPQNLVSGVMTSLSSARQSEVKAWEEEITACEHTLCLEQFESAPIAASGLAHCKSCDLKENLWLCLTCGSLGCGRKQYGGVPGGNGHGLQHFEESGHPVCVKLGTITAEGEADIYCYSCNDAKQDPELKSHLAAFGINVGSLTKTEKSMTELQIEQNLRYDFSLLSEDGKALEPVFGTGLTGLANLGNSCYMASVLQTVFALPSFKQRYFSAYDGSTGSLPHAEACDNPLPADCVECQLVKVADGLLSGRYSHPEDAPARSSEETRLQHESPTPVFQRGVRPMGFKRLVGKGHEEFATMRQQDAEEFLGWFISVVRREKKRVEGQARAVDPTTVFSYSLEQRLQCNECKKVRYRTDEQDVVSVAVPATIKKPKDEGEKKTEYEDVQLTSCIDGLLGAEALEYQCPSCAKNVVAIKQTKFASFPEVLVVHAKKFQLVNWVPAKLDIPIILPSNDTLEFTSQHLGTGLKDGEESLPDESAGGAGGGGGLPEFDEAALGQLQAMGFPLIRCQKALLATGNNGDAEAAMEWLFGHMEDPDIDDPIVVNKSGGGAEPPTEQVSMLMDMGFTSAQAKKALRETSNDAARAVEWLFSHPDDTGEDAAPASGSTPAALAALPGTKDVPVKYRLKAFISHKGPSVHSGHYVAHIRVNPGEGADDGWVLFNDEKVVKADRESVKDLKKLAYLYVFERV